MEINGFISDGCLFLFPWVTRVFCLCFCAKFALFDTFNQCGNLLIPVACPLIPALEPWNNKKSSLPVFFSIFQYFSSGHRRFFYCVLCCRFPRFFFLPNIYTSIYIYIGCIWDLLIFEDILSCIYIYIHIYLLFNTPNNFSAISDIYIYISIYYSWQVRKALLISFFLFPFCFIPFHIKFFTDRHLINSIPHSHFTLLHFYNLINNNNNINIITL